LLKKGIRRFPELKTIYFSTWGETLDWNTMVERVRVVDARLGQGSARHSRGRVGGPILDTRLPNSRDEAIGFRIVKAA